MRVSRYVLFGTETATQMISHLRLHDIDIFVADLDESVAPSQRRGAEVLAVRRLCMRALGENCPEVQHTDSGAPYLPGIDRPFSISHSRTHAAIALGPEGETYGLGIDIEYPRPRLAAIAPRFTNPSDTPARDIEGLLYLWSAKEAAYKAAEAYLPGRPAANTMVSVGGKRRPLMVGDIVVNLESGTATIPDGRVMRIAFARCAMPLPQLICLARPQG